VRSVVFSNDTEFEESLIIWLRLLVNPEDWLLNASTVDVIVDKFLLAVDTAAWALPTKDVLEVEFPSMLGKVEGMLDVVAVEVNGVL
jgi:hypothetical protein